MCVCVCLHTRARTHTHTKTQTQTHAHTHTHTHTNTHTHTHTHTNTNTNTRTHTHTHTHKHTHTHCIHRLLSARQRREQVLHDKVCASTVTHHISNTTFSLVISLTHMHTCDLGEDARGSRPRATSPSLSSSGKASLQLPIDV